MANTLFAVLFSLSFVVMCAATCAATAASYEVYEGEAEQELLAQASEYSQALSQQPTNEMTQALSEISFVDIRCTLIDADGALLYTPEETAMLVTYRLDMELSNFSVRFASL